jgi:hypothetical protein
MYLYCGDFMAIDGIIAFQKKKDYTVNMAEKFPETKIKSGQNHIAYLILALTVLLMVRLLPILKSPLSTYGYDYGFYLYALKHATAFDWHSLLTGYWGGYNSPLFVFLNLFRLPAEAALSLMQVLGSLALGITAYFFFPKQSVQTKIWAILLAAFSIAQNLAYTMFLWKTVIALPFLVLAFKLLAEKKYKAAFFCSLIILLTHRTTAIVFLATAAVFFVLSLIKAKRYKQLFGSLVGAIFIIILFWLKIHAVALALLANENAYAVSGYFLEIREWLYLAWPYALLSLPGIYLWGKNRRHGLLLIFFALCAFWVALRLPFYHRIIIYLDLSLIFFSAYFLGSLNFQKNKIKIAIVIIFIIFAYQATTFVIEQAPLISGAETAEIKAFTQPQGFVLTTSSQDGPWLLGFLNNMRLGAPGLFENPRPQPDWENFWTGETDYQKKFLSVYPRPLYIYERSFQLTGPIKDCLKPISKNFYLFNCN